MSSPKAASRAAAPNAVAASLAALLSPARAEASRRNGARSKGPKTPEGKAHASRNALKHGLRAEHHVVVEGASPEAFAAFEAALLDDLAPEGALQTLLAGRIARAAWRLERAERIEAELFAREMRGPFGDGDLGLALIRDGSGARAFDTLLRYRGAAQAELSRALRTLKALQAEAQEVAPSRPRLVAAELPAALPNKPKARGNPRDSRAEAAFAAALPVPDPAAPLPEIAPALDAAAGPALDPRTDAPGCRAPVRSKTPIEPKVRTNPGEPTSFGALRTAARPASSAGACAGRHGDAGLDGNLL
jgi:hypothetical protein